MDKRTYFTNFIWRSLERWGALGLSFIVSIILARILDPSVYGTIAIVTVLITILDIFLDSGFGNALIQKKDADELDYSSIFYFNVAFSALLYVLLFLLAPVLASFFDLPELTNVVRVMGISVFITGVKNIQQSYVTKHMMFKKFFFATLIGTVCAAVVGLTMAYNGFGVWALVAQYVCNNLVDTIALWILVKWRPQAKFSLQRVKLLFPFAWKLLASSVIFQGYQQLRQLLVGKFYTKSDLAYYNQGYQFPNLLSSNLNASINSIMFPAMSRVQDDKVHVRNMLSRSIKTSQFVVCPFVLGLAACADTFVKVILTDKWLPCVPYLQLFCIAFMFGQMGTANQNAHISVGRSDLKLKTEIGKTGLDLIVLIITVFISPLAIAIGYALSTIPRMVICAWPTKKLLNYSFVQQIKDILPNLCIGLIMAICVKLIGMIKLPTLVLFLVQILIGVVIYVGLSIITKNDSFYYIFNLIKPFFNRKKGKE
mgnify:CR=1 FL=1